MAMTSTTAPGKTFATRGEIADHYKSDWHKYNLKRREAGLPLVEEKEFQMRLEAALAMRKEKEKHTGTDHIKNINSKKNKNKQKNKKEKSETAKATATAKSDGGASSSSSADTEMVSADKNASEEAEAPKPKIPAALAESQENPEIDPKQCLFDQHKSKTLKENLHYMQQKYGFFLPDKECLVDAEGIVGYCHEKIKLGHFCLYCEQVFPTWQGCQQHMIDKQHAKLRYEEGFWEELDPFYDFSKDDNEFVTKIESNKIAEEEKDDAGVSSADNMDVDGDDDGWEDLPEGENEEEEEEMFRGYEREIKRFGLNVNALGELVFPDGRVVGHRALRRYYKQKLSGSTTTSLAIVAAKKASGERLYGGQVVNIHDHNLKHDKVRGAGRGVLVAVAGPEGGPATFSALSLYRYRAAIRKQRKGDFKWEKIKQKHLGVNINRMDKKANRMMNGVSVAHAAR